MRVLITGGTGLIGTALARRLTKVGFEVLVTGRRAPAVLPPGVSFIGWETERPLLPDAVRGASAVVHLVGETVAQRWTAEAKARMRASRVEGTRRLVETLAGCDQRPSTLVSASAIGIYGDRGDEWLTESSPPGDGFLAQLACEWEQAASRASELNIRVVPLRIGLVLDARGGALARMLPAFRLGLGAKLGGGRQWMSWIHLADLVELIVHILHQDRLSGPVNAVAPTPVTNAEFTRTLARTLRRPAVLSAPAPLLRLVFGEMAAVLLASQRVRPQAALQSGFRFRYPELARALADLLGVRSG